MKKKTNDKSIRIQSTQSNSTPQKKTLMKINYERSKLKNKNEMITIRKTKTLKIHERKKQTKAEAVRPYGL